jgi:hypothetical protein
MEDNNNLLIITPDRKKKKFNIPFFIEKISKILSVDKKIKISGKILHYLSIEKNENFEKNINFTFYIFKETEINPFTSDVIIDLELIPGEIPYARIRSDFALPSLYDNRNFYYCLTNEHEFIYNPDEIDALEKLLSEISKTGIENFLFCIKENLQINTFIFYGEYKLQYVYNMNDFLENFKLIKFYRINQIFDKGKEIEEKYIIVTQLYILIFKPLEDDKSFAKLIFFKMLKNVSFNYKKTFNKKLNCACLILYIQDIKTPNGKTYEIEFSLIDRSRPPVVKSDDEEEEEEDDKETKGKKEDNVIKENKEEDPYDKYYLFEEEIEKKQKEINFSKYKLVVENYTALFNHRSSGEKKLKDIDAKNRIMDYEKGFQHCEKMYNYYEGLKNNEKYKKRLDYYIININFFCAELMGFFDLEKTSFQFYFDKMKYYLNLNEKNQ